MEFAWGLETLGYLRSELRPSTLPRVLARWVCLTAAQPRRSRGLQNLAQVLFGS